MNPSVLSGGGISAVKYESSDKRHGHHHHKHQSQSQEYFVKQAFNSAGAAGAAVQGLYGSGSAAAAVAAAAAATGGVASNVEDGIAPFVIKTYELVNDPNTQNLVSWSQEHDKQAFVVCK